MTLAPGGATVFPPRGRPRILGLGFAPSADLQALEALAAAVEAAVRRSGAPPEDRPFHPHVTLARLREPWPAAAIDAFRKEAGAWAAPALDGAFHAFCTRVGSSPAGAVHTPVHTFAFAGARQEVGA